MWLVKVSIICLPLHDCRTVLSQKVVFRSQSNGRNAIIFSVTLYFLYSLRLIEIRFKRWTEIVSLHLYFFYCQMFFLSNISPPGDSLRNVFQMNLGLTTPVIMHDGLISLGSCLIYSQPERHTSLPQTTTLWLAAVHKVWLDSLAQSTFGHN